MPNKNYEVLSLDNHVAISTTNKLIPASAIFFNDDSEILKPQFSSNEKKKQSVIDVCLLMSVKTIASLKTYYTLMCF